MSTPGSEISVNIHEMQVPISSSSLSNSIQSNAQIGPVTNEANVINLETEAGQSKDSQHNKRCSSEAWKYFDKVIINGEHKAVCKNCKKKFVGRATDGTTHLLKHKSRCFGAKHVDIRQYSLTNSVSTDSGKIQFANYVFNQQNARDDLTKMIILHEYPMNMVQHVGFRDFCQSLQPSFVIVSRNTLRGDIIKIYEVEKEKTMKMLEKAKGRISVTTDMWTASNQKKGYMVVTSHYVNDSWVLENRIMRFMYVPAPHTAEIISGCLMDTFMDWNIDRKLCTLTLDNCTSNDAAMDLLKERLNKGTLMLDGGLFHMRCCAHILNLIVQDGLTVIGKGISRIRDSVSHWTATPKRLEKFEGMAKQLGISCSKKLALDCKTRWNSTYLMLVTAMSYKDVFYRIQQRDRTYKCLPTNEDWDLAQQICDKLKIFYKVTLLFSGNKYPTANIFFPQVCEIRLAISKWLMSNVEIVKQMASKMAVKYDKYWSMIHGILGVATILDPRYKCALLEFYFKDIYGEDAENQIERIRRICSDLVKEYESKDKRDQMSNETVVSSSSFDPSFVDNDGDNEDPLARFDSYVSTKTNVSVKSELDRYLDEPTMPRSNEFEILAWWRATGMRYPILQMIARDIYAIPISTVASESAFSTSSRVISPHRSKLNPDILEALMCTQSWFKANMLAECGDIPDFLDDSDIEECTTTVASANKRQRTMIGSFVGD